MNKHWMIAPPSAECAHLASKWRVPPLIAQVLLNRGVSADEPCETFLSPQLRNLYPPSALPGTIQAAKLLVEASRDRKKIVIYGDYDVDGTTGVAILWHALKLAGADVSFYVPHRIEEGYGLNQAAVGRLVEDGAEMIVTVDCGVTAVEIADELRARGVPLIITDHHTPRDVFPKAAAVVHPAAGGVETMATGTAGHSYPNPSICGAGVAFKVAWAIGQQLSGGERVSPEFRELLRELLPLAALGTVADVVPLTGENRIIVRHGLSGLASSSIAGVRALLETAGLTGAAVSSYDAGFKLAPRINAAGRMGHAQLAVELFTRADAARSREIATYLETHNRARQATERKIAKQAKEMIDSRSLASDARRAIVLASAEWHAGVIGIVAGRMVGKFHRPTVLVALSNGEGQGSARSIANFDLSAALARCDDHLLGHGGHAMAAGLRVSAERIDEFTEAFVELANNDLTAQDLVPKLRLDAEVGLSAMTAPTVRGLLELGPFGLGNPKPLLATDWVELAAEPRCVGANDAHLQASFRQNGCWMRGIGFHLGPRIEDLKNHRRCRVAFEPMINDFNGRQNIEMRIVDFQFPA